MAAASECVVPPSADVSSNGSTLVPNGKITTGSDATGSDVIDSNNDVIDSNGDVVKSNITIDSTDSKSESTCTLTLNKSEDSEDQNREDEVLCSIRINGVNGSVEDITERVKMKPSDSESSTTGQVELVTASSSSSISHDTSTYSQDITDSVSLPPELCLDRVKKDSAVRTASDPALRLALLEASDEDKLDKGRLLEEIVALKMQILKLQEENEKLQKVRMEMDEDIHNLTENLFSEAYKMVDEAKGDKVHAEKRLADAAGQIEAMETKVSTLNNLLHTKSSPTLTPHSPHTHKVRRPSVKKLVRKITKKSVKHHHKAVPTSLVEEKAAQDKLATLKEGELVSSEFKLFCEWVEKGLPILPRSHPFMDKIIHQQITPCLEFHNKELSDRVHKAVEDNTLFIESVLNATSDVATFNVPCSLSNETSSPCSYRLRLADTSLWYYISANCRDRIVAVCDFYLFIDYVRKGIVTKENTDLYWQVCRYRGSMSLASLGLSLPDQS